MTHRTVLAVRLALFVGALATGALAMSQNDLILIIGAVGLVALAFGLPLKAAPTPGATAGADPGPLAAGESMAPAPSVLEMARGNPVGALGLVSAFLAGVSAVMTFTAALWIPSFVLWIAAMGLFLVAVLRFDPARGQRVPLGQRFASRGTLIEVGFVALLAAVAFAVRAYDLSDYPPSMHVDEGTQGLFALQILRGIVPITSFASLNTPFHIPILAILGQVAAIATFGPNETGLRILATVYGASCVPLVYLMARQGWGRVAAIVAGVAICFNNLHVHFSKLGATNIETTPWVLIVLLCLWAAQDAARRENARPLAPYAIAGLSMGIAQYFYFSARLIPILAVMVLAVAIIRRKVSLAQLAALAFGALIAFAPLAAQYTRDPDAFIGRAQSVTIFNANIAQHTLGREPKFPDDIVPLLETQSRKMVEFFIQRGDSSSFYTSEIPPFDAATAVLAWIGFGIGLTRLKRIQESTMAFWILTGTVFGGILTVDPPSGARMLAVTPAVFLLAGSAVARGLDLIRATFGPVISLATAPAIGVIVVLIAGVNLDTYFNRYAKMELFASGVKVARELAVNPESYTGYIIGDTNLAGSGPTRYLAYGVKVVALETADKMPSPQPGQGFVVVATPPKLSEIDKVSERYPGGQRYGYTSPQGQLMYVRYRLDPVR
jgi:4-amino-4-deoxy-L-arabinose transferase-like glycosyltransferase